MQEGKTYPNASIKAIKEKKKFKVQFKGLWMSIDEYENCTEIYHV